MLSALNDAGAEYLIVGAYAMAAYGCPRATGDIDVWVRPESYNANAVWSALKSFGAPMSQIKPEDFATSNIVYQIGLAPQRIDILTSIDGVEFEAAWERRMTLDIDGLKISVISAADLRANKLATGRPKDLLDAELLDRLGETRPNRG